MFVLRKRYDKKGKEINVKSANDCISTKWSLLLSKFNDSDLRRVLMLYPKLQPAFPKEFCKKNAGILTDDYGMPDVEICKLHCLNRISNAETISDYKNIKNKLYVYCNCNATHLDGEGTPMCKMGKRRIGNLKKRLEDQFNNIIKKNILTQLAMLCEDGNIIRELEDATSDDINNFGLYLEHYNGLKRNFFGYEVCENVLNSFERLPQLFKNTLTLSLKNCANESAISAAKEEDASPFMLSYHVNLLGNWITDSTKQQIKELVNSKFSILEDFEDINESYKAGYITSKQYLRQYSKLTSDYNAYQFLTELSNYRSSEFPLSIQWYIILHVINLLGYKDLNSYNYVSLEYGESISSIRSLLKWLGQQKSYGRIKDVIYKKAEERICSVLSNDDRWILFEEKIVQSPGDENIHIHLETAYKKKIANKELFKNDCFQDVMLSDVESINDSEIKLFIADNLDAEHQYLIRQKATGLIKLYLWQKHPIDTFDWNLIKTHFRQMSAEIQIRILRYIFSLIASGSISLSLDDLCSEFIETSTPASSAICGVLYILKEKQKDISICITSAMIDSVIGTEILQKTTFLKESKELFYPCNGYLAITPNQFDIDYQSFNGILTKEIKDEELYYVITFYESPVNLFGRTIEWLDSEETDLAEQVLIRNATVDVIDGKYYIHESQEFFVKQFVMKYHIDDKCDLISDKERMIELGFLPRNNAYQPLYTNFLRKYEDADNYVCRCSCIGDSDPKNNIPFFWCQKKICVRRAHFLLPPSKWEEYRFADFLFIVLGQDAEMRKTVWLVNGEISPFFNEYAQTYRSSERNIVSKSLIEDDEKGTWSQDLSTYQDIYDESDEDDDVYNDEYDNYDPDYEERTYDRYNGSYAQDEMGYSDDDIDTIFDGDPDAYWNID